MASMDMASLAATRLTANAEALAAFYETRAALRRAGARGELERPQRRYDPQPRWAAQAQYFSGLYNEVRCLTTNGDDEAVDDVSDDGEEPRVLADDEVRFEPRPVPQKRYDAVDAQPRLELLFEEALVPHRDRDLFLSEWKRGRVDDQALSNEIKGLVLRRAHLREIMRALRAARAAAPPLSIPDTAPPPMALVEAEPSTHVAGVLDPSRSRFFPRAPPLPNCVPVKRKERRLGVSAKFT